MSCDKGGRVNGAIIVPDYPDFGKINLGHEDTPAPQGKIGPVPIGRDCQRVQEPVNIGRPHVPAGDFLRYRWIGYVYDDKVGVGVVEPALVVTDSPLSRAEVPLTQSPVSM